MLEVLVISETLLRDPDKSPLLTLDVWSTLDIDYETPHVERLWCQFDPHKGEIGQGDFRLSLHCIHPCENPFWHVHSVPTAIKVHSGAQRMGIGYTLDRMAPPAAATLILGPGCSYEMIEEDAWHYVNPIKQPSYSTMVTGPVWGRRGPKPPHQLNPLTNEAKVAHWKKFRGIYKVGQ
jgi:hypothetical protein